MGHALRQFEIYMGLLQNAKVPGPRATLLQLGEKVFTAVSRADVDAVFAGRLAAIEAAGQAAREVCELCTAGKAVPPELRKAAAHARRSTKGGHVGLNRFKARVRHFSIGRSLKGIEMTRPSSGMG